MLLATVVTTHSRRVRVAHDSLHSEPVILDVRIGAVASATVAALRVGDIALLPVANVLALAELRQMPGSGKYLSTDSLSTLLHARITVDWEDLTVTISDEGRLPVSQRFARVQRRVWFNTTVATALVPVATTRAASRLPGSLVVDYDIATPTFSGFAQSNIQLALGSTLLGGALDVDWSPAGPRTSGASALSWERDWPERLMLRHVRIGSLRRQRGSVIGGGVFISSEPSARTDSAEPLLLTGALGKGWEVEAYRDQVLTYAGLADSIGGYAIAIPASRGTSRVTIEAHGPLEEQRVINRYITLGYDMVAAGTG
ncbi:MAG TPA: hypothetical protein VII66_00925, partial [Gemmatimonadaceae bacterium]